MTAVIDRLTNKRLKITTVRGGTVVVDDGTATGGTVNISEGFWKGYQPNPGLPEFHPSRIGFEPLTLEDNRRNGKTFTLRVYDQIHSNALKLGTGDLVEFWLDQGGPLTPTTGAFPSWHAHEQGAGQVQHFRGWVSELDISQTPTDQAFDLYCVDALEYADEVKVRLVNTSGDTFRDTVVVGDNNVDSKIDWFWSVKKVNASAPWVFDVGNPADGTLTMTVEDFLDWMEEQFGTELEALGVKPIGVSMFDATSKALLTREITKMSFVGEGFGSVVKKVIQTNYPEYVVRVNPRDQKWYFEPNTLDVIATGATDITNVVSTTVLDVTSTAAFATSGAGSSVRLHSITDRYKTEVADVANVVSGTQIEFSSPLSFTYGVGDILVPMEAASTRPPTILLDKDVWGSQGGFNFKSETQGVYTAVRIMGNDVTTERVTLKDTAPAAGAARQGRIATLHETGFETNYVRGRHAGRTTDRGADGQGIVIDEALSNAGKTELYFLENHSAYNAEHDTSGSGEWEGTVCHILTKNGGDDYEIDNITSIIESFSLDSTTGNVNRYKVVLEDDILVDHADIQDEVNDADPDRFQMTAEQGSSRPKKPNQRASVLTSFTVVNTTAVDEARLLTDIKCPVQFANPATGFTYTGPAFQAQSSTNVPYTFQELKDYWNLNNNPTGGSPGGWFLKRPQVENPTNPGAQSCVPSAVGALLPTATTATFDRVTEDILNVRVPATGFEGRAYRLDNVQRELEVRLSNFRHSSQQTQVQAIATGLHRRLSEPVLTGQLSVGTITRWLPLADLGCRVTFGPGNTSGPLGQVTFLGTVYGMLESISFDLKGGETSISFNSRGFVDDVATDFLNERFISNTAQMDAIEAEQERQAAEAQCIANQPALDPPPSVPFCKVHGYGGEHGGKVTGKVAYKNDQAGGASVSVGIPPLANLASPYDAGSNPVTGEWVAELDNRGRVIPVLVPQGVPYGGTESGSRVIPDASVVADAKTLPRINAEQIRDLQIALWGGDTMLPTQQLRVITAAGSTQTVIQLGNAIPNDGRFNGGFLTWDVNDSEYDIPRHTITSHTATTVTLTTAMTRTAPPAGYSATVWSSRIPPTKSADFPDGGTPIQDTSNNWFVVEPDGTVVSADLVSGTLEIAGSPNDPQFSPGVAGADFTVQGQSWNFDGVGTVSGLFDGTQPGLTTAPNDAISVNGSDLLYIKTPASDATNAGITKDATGGYISAATGVTAGAMTAADKSKLDDIGFFFGTISFRRGSSLSAGSHSTGIVDTSDGSSRIVVPDGHAIDVLWCTGFQRSGSTAGTYTFNYGLTEFNSIGSSTSRTLHECHTVSTSTTDDHVQSGVCAASMDSPLVTVTTSGADKSFSAYMENDSSSPGSTTSDNTVVTLGFMLRKTP